MLPGGGLAADRTLVSAPETTRTPPVDLPQPLARVLTAACAALALLAGGCNATGGNAPGPVLSGSGNTVFVRVESSFVRGARVKVNGQPSSILPTKIVLEVDESGSAIKQYTIAMALNIIANASPERGVTNESQYVLPQGEPPPARISFDIDGIHVYGTALVNRPQAR